MTDEDIFITGSMTDSSVSEGIMSLARSLAKRHGPVNITSEASGIHIYIPDPDLLETDGMKELASKHLAINAEKYLGEGRYSIRGADNEEQRQQNRKDYVKYRMNNMEVPCAISMKTQQKYRVTDLLQMAPIEQRIQNLDGKVRKEVTVGAVRKNLVYDANGNLVPDWVGATVPLSSLPDNHPAIEYLRRRGYEPILLERQMAACYCTKAFPEDPAVNRFYGKLPGGMRITPQGRIILSVLMDGVRWGYQSRLIDKTENGKYYVWGDDQKWHLIRYMNDEGAMVEVYPPDSYFPKGFAPPKYLNATGSERNKLLLGYDAAVQSMSRRPKEQRFCVLCEGPLDAAKLGTPAIAILGKSLSDFQADALARRFDIICTVMDRDAAGKQCLDNIKSRMSARGLHVRNVPVPEGVKDAGDLSYEDAYKLMQQCDPMTCTTSPS